MTVRSRLRCDLLAICFCCDCCCTVRHRLAVDASGFRGTVIRLPGLTIEIDASCIGCGTCLSACSSEPIHLRLSSQSEILDQRLARIHQRTNIGINKVPSARPVNSSKTQRPTLNPS